MLMSAKEDVAASVSWLTPSSAVGSISPFQTKADATADLISSDNSSSALKTPSHRPWLYAIWLASAQVVTAQFNSTVSFTLTSLDGLVDVDGATSWWDGLPSTVDSETGYRTSAGRSSGTSGCSFVGTGFEVHGFGLWKYGEPTDRPWGAVVAQVSHPDQDSQDEPLLTLFGNVTRDPRLLSASNLSLSAYEMTWVRRADSQLQFHNLTVTIPIRTQA